MWSYHLRHLAHLTTRIGIYEHARYAEPRPEHGYCTDDNARLLVVASREPDEGVARRLSRTALAFVINAQADSGLVHNRYQLEGYWRWVDDPSVEDHWGRAVWALGAAAASHPHSGLRAMALWGFEKSGRQRSPWLRSTAFAALGAAEVLAVHPRNPVAHRLLVDAAVDLLPAACHGIPWPERRLTYANAAIPEALIAAGAVLGAPEVTRRGLAMLEWLLQTQIRDGHLSVVGAGGRDLDGHGPQFDQQPIEVAALADACWRAWSVTGDPQWREGVALAADWFLGRNDVGVLMVDERTGGGYDGLESGGCNLNEGAESTLALISTMQRASTLVPRLPSGAADLPRSQPGSAASPRSRDSLSIAG